MELNWRLALGWSCNICALVDDFWYAMFAWHFVALLVCCLLFLGLLCCCFVILAFVAIWAIFTVSIVLRSIMASVPKLNLNLSAKEIETTTSEWISKSLKV